MKQTILLSEFYKLPLVAQNEVNDFINFLLQKYVAKSNPKKIKVDFSWEGTLAGLKESYSSVKLQHKSAAWRYHRVTT